MKGHFDLAPEQWSTLRRLLDTLLGLPPEERATWVEGLGEEYEPFKRRLRSLLERAADGTAALPLDMLPKIETAQFLAGDAGDPGEQDLQAGTSVGPYRLIRPLGEGGMGEVWLAERSDMLQRRRVALKLPRLLTGRAALAERLAREREILAALNHPNIARLYDAGLATDGQPYLALEYVEGERIDAYCARKALDLPARLRLFLEVARAVAHAHANLVVHRDLKPANILVTEAGEVRLLDFGIAKLLEAGAAQETALTELAGRALTPDYAAPEQILGQAIGTAADVYALGVVLFELLTGSRPYKLKRDSRAALEEAIVQAEPPRPSSVATEPKLKRRLRGDLDTIVLKALKKTPAERYGTVEAFAEDIERHAARLPVRAQADSRLYRLRKFVTRNRLWVGAAASVAISVLVGAGASLWQAHVAIREQRRAEEVKNFVAGIFREAGPYTGSGSTSLSAVDLLKLADKRLAQAMVEQPEVRAELSTLIGESLMSFGEIEAAEPILARAADDARRALGDQHDQTVRIVLLQAQIQRLRGHAAQARTELDRILPALRAERKARPRDLAEALTHRTLIAIEEADYENAERLAAEGSSLAAARFGVDDEQTIAGSVLLAMSYRYTKKFELARDTAASAYRAALKHYGESPPHPRVLEAKTIYGRTLADTGEIAAGVALIAGAVDDVRALLGPNSPQLGVFLQNLVAYRIDLGELGQAESDALEAMKILGGHAQTESLTYAATLSALAQVRLARRDVAQAVDGLSQASTLLARVVGPGREATLSARTGRALALADLGRTDEAQAEIDTVAGLLSAKEGGNSLGARVSQVRGAIARLRGDPSAAIAWLLPIAESTDSAPKVQRERMRARLELGLAYLDQGDAQRAAATLEHALQDFERLETAVTPARADAFVGLGRVRLMQGRSAQALSLLERADAFWQDAGAGRRWAGEATFWLGRCQEALGHAASARSAYRRAAQILEHSSYPGDVQLAQSARTAAVLVPK